MLAFLFLLTVMWLVISRNLHYKIIEFLNDILEWLIPSYKDEDLFIYKEKQILSIFLILTRLCNKNIIFKHLKLRDYTGDKTYSVNDIKTICKYLDISVDDLEDKIHKFERYYLIDSIIKKGKITRYHTSWDLEVKIHVENGSSERVRLLTCIEDLPILVKEIIEKVNW